MSTPLGHFLRARRDVTAPATVGLPTGTRRRAPGLRRAELATLAGISVEYLVRIEQGRDRNPSAGVVNALADALRLDAAEREHVRHLTKITGGKCVGARAQPGREVRPGVRRLLAGLEPGIAVVGNRLGDGPRPNLTRYVFTDPRAREVFPDWDRVADEQVFALSCSPVDHAAADLRAELTARAGTQFTGRLTRSDLPARHPLHLDGAAGGRTSWDRETLELPPADAQQLTVYLPADPATEEAARNLLRPAGAPLRAVP
jgi:transcriptional regulator with XRE-family HTH domain